MNDNRYIPWANAGGPNECKHGYAEGIPCPSCEQPSSVPAPAANFVQSLGGLCFAHGPFDSGGCPKHPACATDPQIYKPATPMKIRTKPVDKEAVKLTWDNWSQICEFVPKPWFERGVWLDETGFPLPEDKWRFGTNNDDLGLLINTTEGTMLARGNDWIIKGVNGEFYACKPDVFEKTYDVISEEKD